MNNKIDKIKSHIINDYILKFEDEEILSFSKGIEKFFIYVEYLPFMENDSFILKFDKEETIQNLNNFFNLKFSILDEMKNIFNDISFIYSYSFGKNISKNNYPNDISDILQYFYTGDDVFKIEMPIYDNSRIEKIAHIEMSIIFCTQTNQFQIFYNYISHKGSGYRDESFYFINKNKNELIIELLNLFAAEPLCKNVNQLTLSDHILLKMICI